MGGNVNGLPLIAAHHHTERKIPGTTSHYPATPLYGRNSTDDPFPMPRLALTPPSFPTTEAITVWRLSPETLSPQHRHPPAIRRSGSRFVRNIINPPTQCNNFLPADYSFFFHAKYSPYKAHVGIFLQVKKIGENFCEGYIPVPILTSILPSPPCLRRGSTYYVRLHNIYYATSLILHNSILFNELHVSHEQRDIKREGQYRLLYSVFADLRRIQRIQRPMGK